jgi:hypothetical protein
MIKNYKKGDVLLVRYRIPFTNNVIDSVGVLYKKSKISVVLVHNFYGQSSVDNLKIFIKDIIKIDVVKPVELNSVEDFSKTSND